MSNIIEILALPDIGLLNKLAYDLDSIISRIVYDGKFEDREYIMGMKKHLKEKYSHKIKKFKEICIMGWGLGEAIRRITDVYYEFQYVHVNENGLDELDKMQLEDLLMGNLFCFK